MRVFTTNATGTRILARDPNDNDRICCSAADASLLCHECRSAWAAAPAVARTTPNALGLLGGAGAALRELRHDEVRDADGFVWNVGCWGELPEPATTTPDPLDGWARR